MPYILFGALFCLPWIRSCPASPPHLSSLFSPSLCLELSDAVCLCLPLQEVRTECWHASLSSPTSTSLVPAVSSILPLSASAGLLHPPPPLHLHPSVQIPNLRSSAGDGVGTGLQQLSTLPEHPSHNAPSFPSQHALRSPTLAPWCCCLLVSDWLAAAASERNIRGKNSHFPSTDSLEYNYQPTGS